jgi:hypothetical protein
MSGRPEQDREWTARRVRRLPPRWLALGLPLLAATAWAAEETNQFRPPRPLLGPPFWEQHGTLVLVLGAVGLIGSALAVWWVRRPRQTAGVPAVARTRAALQALQGRAEDDALARDVSQILRRYVIDALELPHEELTTAELDAVLQDPPRTSPALAAALVDFLRECDVEKFAPLKPPTPRGFVARALDLVAQVEAERKPPPVQSTA